MLPSSHLHGQVPVPGGLCLRRHLRSGLPLGYLYAGLECGAIATASGRLGAYACQCHGQIMGTLLGGFKGRLITVVLEFLIFNCDCIDILRCDAKVMRTGRQCRVQSIEIRAYTTSRKAKLPACRQNNQPFSR
jgi:hypothetical protein